MTWRVTDGEGGCKLGGGGREGQTVVLSVERFG